MPYLERFRVERHNHQVLDRHIRDLCPDVVSFWPMGGLSHSLIESVGRGGRPIVAFVHDQWLDYGRFFDQWSRMFYGTKGRMLAAPVERVTGIPTRVNYDVGRYVFVSEFLRQKALEITNLRDTAVAPSGISPEFFPAGPEHDWSWRLLFVGRLHPDKGIHDAVAALERLPQEATLTFVGTWDPRDERTLAEMIAARGHTDRVTMLGQQAPEAVAELYRSHDALLFPVRWDEPWGLVPIEAMASGCPVIATRRGGSAEYLRDGENALIVAAEDPAAIDSAVRRLAADKKLRGRLRRGGGETAPRHTEPIFNQAVERHLLEVVGASASVDQAPVSSAP
jgi:glycosyltransferase involved in cell wall biosynthesis